MINNNLINPQSIVVVGGSDNVQTPGGKIVKNLIDGNFTGKLFVINLKADSVQGIKSYKSVKELPQVDLAIIAIAAKFTLETVQILATEKQTRGFIIISAGYSEESHEGADLENKIVEIIESVNGSLIGPNCIGLLNTNYNGVFTTPIPELSTQGVDFVSGSGATAVFIIESAMAKGLKFSSVWSVGNSAQLGVEDILEYLDDTFDAQNSSKVKLLYIESVNKPQKLLKHARSLIAKGCKIAAIKAGSSEAGSRAASSHTGALASPDVAVNALFEKAGIVRCYGREELTTVASIFMLPALKGENIAIITHAGGPAVMLTDALSNGGLKIPPINSPELLEKLYSGSSVSNPIDFLATGTAAQLGDILDFCESKFTHIDGMAVIFGSPGLSPVFDVYELLHQKMKTSKKPIFPILPSVVNVKNEIEEFVKKGNVCFPDEVIFGNALSKVFASAKKDFFEKEDYLIDKEKIRKVIASAENGYLQPEQIQNLLDAAGILRAGEGVAKTQAEALQIAQNLGFQVVMKVIGPVHKSDVGGVVLNVTTSERAALEFERMIQIKDTTAILIQPMLSGIELFVGAKREGDFGHLLMCGLGGIFIEILKDVRTKLCPITKLEAQEMIRNLKSYGIIKGARGQKGVNEEQFAEILARLSALLEIAPEIFEMDINPLLGSPEKVIAVDARIRIEKSKD